MDRLLVAALWAATFVTLVFGEAAEVRLSNGQRLRGATQKAGDDDSQIRTFLGVPFGKPTGGKRRFLAPEAIDRLPTDPYPATKHASPCWGAIDDTFGRWPGSDMWNPKNNMSEDCLQLNLWAPPPRMEKYAVLVWIFGGGFFSGSPSLPLYDGAELAAREKLIVLNLNYRLGPFGFLYLGSGSGTGNAGLLDQRLGLEWVRKEIAAFGGDPDKVTIWGESAGAASVSAHLIAEGSRHLFRGAIMQSGAVLNRWALVDEATALNRSARLLAAAKCASGQMDDKLGCLQVGPPA